MTNKTTISEEQKQRIFEEWRTFLVHNPDYDSSLDEVVDTNKIFNYWLSQIDQILESKRQEVEKLKIKIEHLGTNNSKSCEQCQREEAINEIINKVLEILK